MGRPLKYSPRFIKREAIYLLRYANSAAIPFEQEFARGRKYSAKRLSEFANKMPLFSEALQRFKDIQQHKLIIGALANKINSTFVIFTMKNVAGWRDVNTLIDQSQHNHFISIKHFIEEQSKTNRIPNVINR